MSSEETEHDELDEDEEELTEEDIQDVDDIIEIFGQLPWASPADLERLGMRLERQKDLRTVMRAFKRESWLKRACALGWLFIIAQIEYRVKTLSSVYVFVYGTRGMGKSEVAMHIALLVVKAYKKYLSRIHELAFGRSPSDLNRELKEATREEVSLVLISDEAESEVGIGSATEEQGLVGNLDTMRVLMHSVLRCAIMLRWGFATRCDFILEPIYQDRENEVNYCVVYTVDPERDRKVAKFIVDIPLHKNKKLRAAYESWKLQAQEAFTGGGGRRSGLKKKLEPIVDRLVKIAKQEEMDPRSWTAFEIKVVFAMGDQEEPLTNKETVLVCKQAFEEYKEYKDEGTGGKDYVPPSKGYFGQVANIRDAIYERLDKLGFGGEELEMLKRYIAGETQADIAYEFGTTQKTVSIKIKGMRLNPMAMGRAFEDVYSNVLREEGKHVIQGGMNTPDPDVIVTDEEGVYLDVRSCKCYADRRTSLTIPRSEIAKKEFEVSQSLGIPLYLVFYDIVGDKLFDPIQVYDQARFTFKKTVEWKRKWRVKVKELRDRREATKT